MVLLRVQRKGNGFTMVLLRVKQETRVYNGFAEGLMKKALVLLWFCLGSKENNGFTLVLLRAKRKSTGFTMVLLKVQ